jgi:hypothetical protein
MKIAVLLTGNIRTWSESNLLDFIDIDVDYFISTSNKKYNYHPFISNKFGYDDINDLIISDDEIKNMFNIDYKELIINDDDEINDSEFSINMRNIDSCYHQFNRIKKILNYVENHEVIEKYDLIVKTRLDLKYQGRLSQYLNVENFIYTSTGNGDPNDTIIISKRDNFFNIINNLLSEFYNQIDSNSHLNPPHGLLQSMLDRFQIQNRPNNIAEIIRLKL